MQLNFTFISELPDIQGEGEKRKIWSVTTGLFTYYIITDIILQTEHYNYFKGQGRKQRRQHYLPCDPDNLRAEKINIWAHLQALQGILVSQGIMVGKSVT